MSPPADGQASTSVPMKTGAMIERHCLARLLDQARRSQLTLVVGPAGAGKSILLHQWRHLLDSHGVTVAVYDATDFSALRSLARAIRAEVSQRHAAYSEHLSAAVTNGANGPDGSARDQPANPWLVVLIDGFDTVDDAAAGRDLLGILGDFPEGLHLGIFARARPKLEISRLSTQGLAHILSFGDLAFTAAEAAELLGLPPDSELLPAILDTTRGWPVAVELLRKQAPSPLVAIPKSFCGRDGEMADYLTEQVVSALPPDLSQPLFELALFDRITPELANHALARTDGSFLLSQLADRLPGLVEKDIGSDGISYALNPLLLDYGRERMDRNASRKRQLHRRAVTWFEGRDDYPDAIHHARQLQDPIEFDRLLTGLNTWRLACDRGIEALFDILRTLTADEIEARPRIRLMAAMAHFKTGFFEEGCELLSLVRQQTNNFLDDGHGSPSALQRDGYLMESIFYATTQGVLVDDRLLDRTAAPAIAGDARTWATCELNKSVVLEMRGDLVGSLEALKRMEAYCRGTRAVDYLDTWLPFHFGFLALARGALREASERVAKPLKTPAGVKPAGVPTKAMATIIDSASIYERRFVESAAYEVRDALDLLGSGDMWFGPCAIAYPIIVELAHRRGGREEMSAAIAELRDRAIATGIGFLPELVTALEASWLIRSGAGDATRAAILGIQSAREADDRVPWRLLDAQMTALSLWHISEGEGDRAIERANLLISTAERGRRLRSVAKGRVLKVLAFAKAGQDDQALKELEALLGQAAQEQMVALFAEEGEQIAPLIRMIAGSNGASLIAKRHAATVLRALPLARRSTNPLNQRETEIVTFLQAGESNKLIARRLGVTENTIKFHMKSIFTKLGVTSRKNAAIVASERLADEMEPPRLSEDRG